MIIHTHTTSLYIKKQLQLLKVRYQLLIIKKQLKGKIYGKREKYGYIYGSEISGTIFMAIP